jgi:predicted lipid-binding transport protein (Tim44 family)
VFTTFEKTMKSRSGLLFSTVLALFLILATLHDAEARRFGGGGNFGGRSNYSAPYQRSVQPPTRSANPSQQHQAGQQTPGAKPGWARPGLTGFLGGLMMGGLLGSLFGGGGFHGVNFMDFLILGGLAFVLFKFLAARKSAQQPQPAFESNYQRNYQPDDTIGNLNNGGANTNSGFNTDLLFDKNKQPPASNAGTEAAPGNIPPSFDEQGFLNGAKVAYQSLQKAWDTRDLADIRGLTTDKVFAEIQDQLKSSTEENHTDVLKLNAELLDVREIGNEIEAVVMFDAIMREDQDGQAGQVREVWHFVKPNNPAHTKWLLDGIQQLAE